MDEDVLYSIKKAQKFAEEFPNYPCAKCRKRSTCDMDAYSKICYKWREWFIYEWRKIRKAFGKL